MYAKSMIGYACARFAAGEIQRHLSYIPVVLALAVAVLPFMLGSGAQHSYTQQPEELAAEVPAENLLRTAAAVTPSARMALPEERRYKAIADYMSRKYRVSQDAVHELVKTAHTVGRQLGVDPLLLVAVMAVESSFNPIAESVAGAKGLMQIIPRYHLEKFPEPASEAAAFDPRTNILVGARIIREYLAASSGDLFTALQTYAGALGDRDAVYAHRVLNEKDRLDELSGMPKTDRGLRVVRLELPATQQPGAGRVSVTLPTPGTALPASAPDARSAAPAPMVINPAAAPKTGTTSPVLPSTAPPIPARPAQLLDEPAA